jgi:hypothetical protein
MLNAQMVKIWIINQMMVLKDQVEMGLVLEVVGRAKIRQLEEFYDLFNLDDISLEDVDYSGSDLIRQIRPADIVSHKPEVTI